jgi:hypothetical protein
MMDVDPSVVEMDEGSPIDTVDDADADADADALNDELEIPNMSSSS